MSMDLDNPTAAQRESAQDLISRLSRNHNSLLNLLFNMCDDEAYGSQLFHLLAAEKKKDVDEVLDALESKADFRIICKPWVDLPLGATYGQPMFQMNNPSFIAPLRIKAFPNEIVFCIADFLPLESRVALAMTDQHLMGLFGRRFLAQLGSGNPNVKFNFLRLLERDIPSMVACPLCNTIHDPLKDQGRGGLCGITEMHYQMHLSPRFPVHFPRFLNYNIVRAIANEQARAGYTARVTELLDTIHETAGLTFDGVTAIRTANAMIIREGNLMMLHHIAVDLQMSQHIITGISPEAVIFLEGCLTNPLFQMCCHGTWQEFLDHEFHARHGDNLRGEVSLRMRNYDYRPNYGNEPIKLAELKQMLHRIIFDAIDPSTKPDRVSRGMCEQCATYFEIGCVGLPDYGRVFTMTTWKDLGCPSDGDRYSEGSFGKFAWESHRYRLSEH